MTSIVHNVRDLDGASRHSLESVLGQQLNDNQQILIRVINVDEDVSQKQVVGSKPATPGSTLPDYCNVYEGMSDEEIAELEKLILDRSPSRHTP